MLALRLRKPITSPVLAHLGIAQVIQSLLVGGIGLLQIIHHQVTMAQTTPGLAAGRVQFQDILKVLDGLGELLLGAQDARDGIHGRDGPLIVAQCLFIRIHGTVKVAHEFSQAAYKATESIHDGDGVFVKQVGQGHPYQSEATLAH